MPEHPTNRREEKNANFFFESLGKGWGISKKGGHKVGVFHLV